MTIRNHTLGFPRVGLRRELKKSTKKATGQETPRVKSCWQWAANCVPPPLGAAKAGGRRPAAGGRFRWYDHVLTTSLLLGNVPARHQNNDGSVDIDTLFRIGRGRAPTSEPAAATEMTSGFNTNYHYMVRVC